MADLSETFMFKRLMKKIKKIIGYLGLSLALGHTPYGQAITLEQINEAFEAGRKESIQNLEKLLQEVDCSDKTSEAGKIIQNLLKNRSYYSLLCNHIEN